MRKWIFLFVLFATVWGLVPNGVQAQEEPPPTKIETATAVATNTSTLTPTLTATVLPTQTPTPSQTATAVPPIGDVYEPNDEPGQATVIHLNETMTELSLAPAGDKDYFSLYLKAGQLARAATFPEADTDTRLTVYSDGGELLGQNDDRSQTDLGSTVVWTAPADGWYLLVVASATPLAGLYQLLATLEMPTAVPTQTPTGTPGPTATPAPTQTAVPTATPYTQADAGEPNNRPEDAFPVLPGTTYDMTLGPLGIDAHDFFTLLGKAGVTYRCEATAPQGIDPTMRVYAGEIGSGVLVAENDDLSPADIGSAVTFSVEQAAPLFIVVETRAGYGSYQFQCSGGVQPPAAVAGGQAVLRPTATLTPTLPAKTLRIELFIDINGDETMVSNEGIDELAVIITPPDRQWTLIRTAYQGEVILTPDDLQGIEQVIVSVPYLHYSAVVTLEPVTTVPVMLTAPALPVMLP